MSVGLNKESIHTLVRQPAVAVICSRVVSFFELIDVPVELRGGADVAYLRLGFDVLFATEGSSRKDAKYPVLLV